MIPAAARHAGPAALVLLAAAAGAACRRSAPTPPPRPVLGEIRVQDETEPGEAGAAIDPAALEPELRRRLLATQLFAGPPPDGGAPDPKAPVTRARVRVALSTGEVGDKGLARARVQIRLETRPSDAPGAIDEQLEGQGERPYRAGRAGAGAPDELAAQLQRMVTRMAGDLIDGFGARRRLRDGSSQAVHAALLGDAGELREEAIHAAGRRHLVEEVPALLKLLADPDEPTRDAALGALIALRERRAVSELTRTRSLRDRREMRKIIEAIAILGGKEAEDYLSFVAQTHDDEEIRAEAAAAKARLDRRAGDAGA